MFPVSRVASFVWLGDSIVGMYRETGEPVYSVLYQGEGGGALY